MRTQRFSYGQFSQRFSYDLWSICLIAISPARINRKTGPSINRSAKLNRCRWAEHTSRDVAQMRTLAPVFAVGNNFWEIEFPPSLPFAHLVLTIEQIIVCHPMSRQSIYKNKSNIKRTEAEQLNAFKPTIWLTKRSRQKKPIEGTSSGGWEHFPIISTEYAATCVSVCYF